MMINDLPFNQFIGLAVANKDGFALSLSGDVRYTNHLGTVHASALLALAEATSGAHLLAQFPALGFEVVPVVRRVEAKFRKPAIGATFSKASTGLDDRATFLSELKARGRARLEIDVDVYDEHESHALTATFEWFVARRDVGNDPIGVRGEGH